MTTDQLLLLAFTLGAMFAGSVVLCIAYVRAASVVEVAPVVADRLYDDELLPAEWVNPPPLAVVTNDAIGRVLPGRFPTQRDGSAS